MESLKTAVGLLEKVEDMGGRNCVGTMSGNGAKHVKSTIDKHAV